MGMNKNMCCGESWMPAALLALRLAVGVVFAVHGWAKLGDVDAFAGMLSTGGWPLATFFAWVVAIVEFVGGLMLIVGIYARLAAKLLAIIMIVALLFVHTKLPWATAELPLVLLGGSLAIMAMGGGKWRLMKTECACEKM